MGASGDPGSNQMTRAEVRARAEAEPERFPEYRYEKLPVSSGVVYVRPLTKDEKARIARYLDQKARNRQKARLFTPEQIEKEARLSAQG